MAKVIYRLLNITQEEVDAMKEIIKDSTLCGNGSYLGYDSEGHYTNCPMVAQNHQESGKEAKIIAKKKEEGS